MANQPIPGTQVPCNSTGGTLTYTKTGYIHTGGKYGSSPAAKQTEQDEL